MDASEQLKQLFTTDNANVIGTILTLISKSAQFQSRRSTVIVSNFENGGFKFTYPIIRKLYTRIPHVSMPKNAKNTANKFLRQLLATITKMIHENGCLSYPTLGLVLLG